ncbi:methyltransferase [Candidatus Woesearchaeota archaeon]|nr:methyltransferase [Candidatus Woesearchaeota archaeon]
MVYEPAEDSFLIQKEVKKLARGRVMDMGTGSGILAETALKSKRVRSVLGADIKKEAVEHCRRSIKNRKASFIVSDLFSKVPKPKNKAQLFDTIIFNPPYLPEQEGELWELKTDVAGGKHGYEIIGRFLADVNDYLAPDGIILLLFSTITGKMKVDELIAQHMMDSDRLNKLNIAFEQLYVYRLKKNRFRKLLEKQGVSKIAPLSRGHRGLIFTGIWKNKKITVKIQRQDIGAKGTVDNEVKQLKKLNKHSIGPTLLFSGKDYFAYNYIEGDFIRQFIDRSTTKKDDVIDVLKKVFEQMYLMDHLGLNKEEMHHPVKHIIVTKGKKPVLVDFERCKPKTKPHNVTQFAQFVISGKLLHHMQRHNIKISMLEMLNRARRYSERRSRENFDAILALLE